MIGKVIKKRKKDVLVSHWNTCKTEDRNYSVLVECEKCNLDNGKNANNCQHWVKKKEIAGVLPGIRQENNQKIPVLLEELSEYKESHTENRSNSREKVVDKKIKTYVHETSLLKMQGFDNNLETLLLKQLEENMKVDCIDYSFYTDRSLVKEENECRMGASWVQVSKDESRLLMKGKIRIAKWPSSTKAELAAV